MCDLVLQQSHESTPDGLELLLLLSCDRTHPIRSGGTGHKKVCCWNISDPLKHWTSQNYKSTRPFFSLLTDHRWVRWNTQNFLTTTRRDLQPKEHYPHSETWRKNSVTMEWTRECILGENFMQSEVIWFWVLSSPQKKCIAGFKYFKCIADFLLYRRFLQHIKKCSNSSNIFIIFVSLSQKNCNCKKKWTNKLKNILYVYTLII